MVPQHLLLPPPLPLNNASQETNTCGSQSDLEGDQDSYSRPQFWNNIFPDYSFRTLLACTDTSLVWLGNSRGSSEPLALKITQRFQTGCSKSSHQNQQKTFFDSHKLKHMVDIQQIQEKQEDRLLVMKYYPWSMQQLAKRAAAHSQGRQTQPFRQFVTWAFRSMLIAVQQLHQIGYVHRDLKLDNFMVDLEFNVFLNDFQLVTQENQLDTSFSGTEDYMAPQRLEDKARKTKPIRKEVDIWSLGILLYQLYTGETPYIGNRKQELLNDIYWRNVFNKSIPSQMMKIIQEMLQIKPENRLALADILKRQVMNQECDLQFLKGSEKQ